MIVNFILINGNQLIGDPDQTGRTERGPEFTEGFILVKKPRIISTEPNPENPQQPMVKLIPLAFAAGIKDEIELNLSTVCAISDISVELHNYYKQVTSGIDLTTRLTENAK